MKLSNDEMQNGGNEEGNVSEDTGSPPKGTSVTEVAKNTNKGCEKSYVNDDMGPPEKVRCSLK